MKVNVAWSTEGNEEVAGKTCAKKAVLDLMETKIAFLYSSVEYDTEKRLNGVQSVMGTAPIIGATSRDGIIVPDGYITSQGGYAGMLAIGDPDTKVTTAITSTSISPVEDGKKVAKRAMEKAGTKESPAYFMMIATPGNEENFLKGIQDVIGDVPCFGGTASDDDLSGQWRIYTEEGIVDDGVAVAFFYTNKKMQNIIDGKYHETIHSGIVTAMTGERELDEINGIQALKQYAEWTNNKVKDLKGSKLFNKSILEPIGVKNSNNFIILRHPINGNTDYSINLSNDMYINTAVIHMQCTKGEMINAPHLIARELNKKTDNQSAFYIINHSADRKEIIEGNLNDIAKKIKDEIGDIPFIMPFTYGEYGRNNHSTNLCGSLMISEVAICK